MNISTATTAPASVPAIKRDGLPWCPSSYSKAGNNPVPVLFLREQVWARGTLNREPRVEYDASASVGSQTIYVASPHSHPRLRSRVGGVFRTGSRTLSQHRRPAPAS